MNTHSHARADEQWPAPRGSEPSYRQRTVQSAATQQSNHRNSSSSPPGVVRSVEYGQFDQLLSPDITDSSALRSFGSQWSASSAWPNHPALLPPAPRPALGDRLAELADALLPTAAPPTPAPTRAPSATPRRTVVAAPTVKRAPYAPTTRTTTDGAAPTAPRRYSVPTPANTPTPRPARPGGSNLGSAHSVPKRLPAHRQPQFAAAAVARPKQLASTAQRSAPAHDPNFPANLGWPKSFDDWMIDIVRRRALRLNSGARRRGAGGSVRAVDLAHILERSADEQGRWRCAICHLPVTLEDLSFDHVVALADGGEHAAHNLVPAHRKCNEIKGSEKAQYRAQALDRWLSEWSGANNSANSSANSSANTPGASATTQQRRLA